ncbi:hypothetical protein [Synechococcus phage BUCT-ZZ01]|nr:hypothetical protein [Synechococcus phage BUCT-ZZ01]
MATLDAAIKKLLESSAEAPKVEETVNEDVTTEKEVKEEVSTEVTSEETVNDETEVVEEETKKEDVKSSVSEQVSALLAVEGLSEEFKTQAIAIFEAAVADRVLVVKEELEKEFETKLEEAKVALTESVDGYMAEAIQTWGEENKLPIVNSYKADLLESLVDGLRSTLVEHSVEIPEESVQALDVALEEVEKLEEALAEKETATQKLVEELNTMKKEQIIESYSQKMTPVEFDRFTALIESIQYTSEDQYSKQLEVVRENFGKTASKKTETKVLEESVIDTKDVDPRIAQYAQTFKQ